MWLWCMRKNRIDSITRVSAKMAIVLLSTAFFFFVKWVDQCTSIFADCASKCTYAIVHFFSNLPFKIFGFFRCCRSSYSSYMSLSQRGRRPSSISTSINGTRVIGFQVESNPDLVEYVLSFQNFVHFWGFTLLRGFHNSWIIHYFLIFYINYEVHIPLLNGL